MTKRGKILKDASSGPGLVWVDGQQYPFGMGPIWKSGVPAAAGMTVEVEFAADGGVAGITQVTESQIAKEQAEAVMNAARQKGGAVLSSAVASFGLPLLVATGLLIVSWFFLSAVSVDSPLGKVSFTFWQVLGLVNAGNAWSVIMQGGSGSSTGIYGFFCIVALAGPFLRFVWKPACQPRWTAASAIHAVCRNYGAQQSTKRDGGGLPRVLWPMCNARLRTR